MSAKRLDPAQSASQSRRKHPSSTLLNIEIMDTTLRDGEQTEGVSIMKSEKLAIARALLETLKVDRIEIASARVSPGEQEASASICEWAKSVGLLERVEMLGFVDGERSIEWVHKAGGKVINLLTKGSRRHCETQLRKSTQEHIKDILTTLKKGTKRGIAFNIYLEDWSGGMLQDELHVFEMVDALKDSGVRRIMLPDTLGILDQRQAFELVSRMVQRYPQVHFDFHAHNDYGLGVANSIEALRAGAHGVHVTINGLGERAGNAPLEEVVVAMADFTDCRCMIDEKKLQEVSHLTEVFTGKRVAWNKPIVGENVFTQTAGIHADGDKKGDLYSSRLTPLRFGRNRTYALGKLMGRANLDFALKKLGIELSEEQKQLVMARIIEMGDNKKVATGEDLPFIIADVLQTPEDHLFDVIDFMIVSSRGLMPTASVRVRYRDNEFHATSSGDGGYDAFMKALRSIEHELDFKIPRLIDYSLRIPPGGRTDALVEATITWEGGMKTRAVNCDQIVAAIQATMHAINLAAKQALIVNKN